MFSPPVVGEGCGALRLGQSQSSSDRVLSSVVVVMMKKWIKNCVGEGRGPSSEGAVFKIGHMMRIES